MFARLGTAELIAGAEHRDIVRLISKLSLKLRTILHNCEYIFRRYSNQSNSLCFHVGRTTMPQISPKTILQQLRECHIGRTNPE
jgi:hypothetical protein